MSEDVKDHPTEEPRALFREVGVIYAVAFFSVLVLALVALGVGVIAANLYALVAAIFVGLPYWWLGRKGLDAEEMGLTWTGWPRGIAWGLLFTILTLIPFAAGQYIWESEVQGRTYAFSLERYHRWPVELEGAPKQWGSSAGAWVWSKRNRLYLGARTDGDQPGVLMLEADAPFRPRVEGTGVMIRAIDLGGKRQVTQGPSRRWEVLPTTRTQRVLVSVEAVTQAGEPGPRTLTVRPRPPREGVETWTLHAGPEAREVESGELDVKRSLWWMALWGLTQLLFIALPEEFFYRGYVQTRLSQAMKARAPDGREKAMLGVTWAMVMTSALFAIGHLLIPVNGVLLAQRASVFFPSLVFGWLRARTGSIVASTIYHAACNLMVLFTAIHFI